MVYLAETDDAYFSAFVEEIYCTSIIVLSVKNTHLLISIIHKRYRKIIKTITKQ